MALDARRKQILDVMGIDVWVSKDAAPVLDEMPQPLAEPVEAAVVSEPEPKPKSEPKTEPKMEKAASPPAVQEVPDDPFLNEELPPLDAYENEPPVEEEEGCFDDFLTPGDGVSKLGWDELAERVAACTCCELSKTRKQTVFGSGDRKAKVMFIGEAPGQDEDTQGEPFVGQAGQLLTAMLKSIGFDRDQVFIANVLKCRPPNNRDPQADEARHCLPYLQRQIALVEPDVLVCLGRLAVHNLLNTSDSLARLRGRSHSMPGFDIPVVVTYHPAYLLRTSRDKRKSWEDLLYIKGLL